MVLLKPVRSHHSIPFPGGPAPHLWRGKAEASPGLTGPEAVPASTPRFNPDLAQFSPPSSSYGDLLASLLGPSLPRVSRPWGLLFFPPPNPPRIFSACLFSFFKPLFTHLPKVTFSDQALGIHRPQLHPCLCLSSLASATF